MLSQQCAIQKYKDLLRQACKRYFNDVKPSPSFIRDSTDIRLRSEDCVHSYVHGVGMFHISSSFHLEVDPHFYHFLDGQTMTRRAKAESMT